jgi:hypothetical protein
VLIWEWAFPLLPCVDLLPESAPKLGALTFGLEFHEASKFQLAPVLDQGWHQELVMGRLSLIALETPALIAGACEKIPPSISD